MQTLPLILAAFSCLPSDSPGPRGPNRAQEDAELKPLVSALEAFQEAEVTGEDLGEARQGLVAEVSSVLDKGPFSRMSALRRALELARVSALLDGNPGKITEAQSPEGSFFGSRLTYTYRTPKDYKPGKVRYPLILVIADADGRPAEHLREYWGSKEVLEGAIVASPHMPEAQGEWDQVMVNGRPAGLCNVLATLRIAREHFAVDFDRIYLAGYGKGVPAAIAAGNYAPQCFAGVVTRTGDLQEIGPENFRNLPTLLCGGGARARAFAELSTKAGFDHCELADHRKESEVWAWMQEHVRPYQPVEVSVTAGDPFPTFVDWLRISPIAPKASIQAKIVRQDRRIELSGSGASFATIYLYDELLTLDGDLTVVYGDKQQTLTPKLSAATVVDLLREGTSDPRRVYLTEIVVDLRADAPRLVSTGGDDADWEFNGQLAAAKDVEDFWQLHRWCQRNGREGRSFLLLERVLAMDPEHQAAREALADLSAGHRELNVVERRKLKEGAVLLDGQWVAAEDRDQLALGRWLVDGEWLPLSEANERHAHLDNMWSIPGRPFHLHATVDRQIALRARSEMESAYQDLVRVFGMEPEAPLRVALLRDEEQYDRFAFGDPDGKRRATHAGRLHVVHSAYFAESWYTRIKGHSEFRGTGVGYWDSSAPGGDAYGRHAARLAAGFSFVDAIDPSPKAVRKGRSKGAVGDYYANYQSEKRLPRWLRFGAAVYAERYFIDEQVPTDGDPHWARKWSTTNLRDRGGLRPLDEVFAFRVDPEQRDDGLKLYIEAGLLVAFLLDGDVAPLEEQHERFKRLLAAGQLRRSHLDDLEAAIRKHEAELRVFAGL